MSVKATHREDFDQLAEPGDFIWSHHASDGEPANILFVCPCGCGDLTGVPVRPAPQGPHWNWNGDQEKPTLTPSLQRLDNCKWHGFLTDGEFRSC
jgi:hypothetical protein